MKQRIKVREPFVSAPTRESLVSNKSRIREQVTGTPAGKSKRSTRDTYAELGEVMRGLGLGLNQGEARRASAGRDGVVLREAAKNIAGLPERCFAYPAVADDPVTWQFQLCRVDDPSSRWQPESDLVQLAVSQVLGPAMTGTTVPVPDADLPAVLARLKSAWIDCGLDLEAMPAELRDLELVNALRNGGDMSMREALAAARGRDR